MNIHEAVLQPIAAFVYCNRQASAGRRRQTKVGNFRAPECASATNSARGFAKIILWWNHAWNKIICLEYGPARSHATKNLPYFSSRNVAIPCCTSAIFVLLIANSALTDRTESSKSSSMLVIVANKQICRQMTGSCFLFWLVNFWQLCSMHANSCFMMVLVLITVSQWHLLVVYDTCHPVDTNDIAPAQPSKHTEVTEQMFPLHSRLKFVRHFRLSRYEAAVCFFTFNENNYGRPM